MFKGAPLLLQLFICWSVLCGIVVPVLIPIAIAQSMKYRYRITFERFMEGHPKGDMYTLSRYRKVLWIEYEERHFQHGHMEDLVALHRELISIHEL